MVDKLIVAVAVAVSVSVSVAGKLNYYLFLFCYKTKQILRRMMFRMMFLRGFHFHTNRCMSSSNVVMSFGDASQGALGLPGIGLGLPDDDAYEPTIVPSLPSDVCAVSAGHYHSLAITSSGHLWSWGRNRESQLGHLPPDANYLPNKVEALNDVNVVAAFASGVISTAIGDDGSLWVWGTSKRGQLGLGQQVIQAVVPTRVQSLSHENIVKVSLGWGHALALTETGKLYGWGYAADGRLGRIFGEESSAWESEDSTPDHISKTNPQQQLSTSTILEAAEKHVSEGMEKEKHMPIIWEPTLIQDVHGVEVVDVACGFDHSLLLCRNGILLSNGSNVYGQLGREGHSMDMLPVNTEFLPVSIASGLGHSFAICQLQSPEEVVEGAKNIVSWGWNQSFQLGRAGPNNLPLVVQGLEGEMPISVSGGRVHSIALTSKREVWVWGCGKNGRLGLGSSIDENEPCLLDCLDGCEVLQAVSGFDHNLVLISE